MTRQSLLRFETLNLDATVRAHLSRVLKESKESRAVIALRMSECSGQEVTEASLNNWTAPSKDTWRIPACLIPAFCYVTEDYSLFDVLLKPLARRLATEDEERQSRIGEIDQKIHALQSEKERLLK